MPQALSVEPRQEGSETSTPPDELELAAERLEKRSQDKADAQEQPKPDPVSLLHDLVKAIGGASDVEEIYGQSLDSLKRGLDADRSAILLFDPDGVMRFKAWRGLSEPYRQAVEGHSPWNRDSRDPQAIWVEDVLEERSLSALRGTITAEGIRALAFLPLVYRDRLLGKFMIYSDVPRRFSDADARLAATIAAQVAFALARRHVEERMTLFHQIFANAHDGVAIIDSRGRYVEQNAAHAAFLGYSDEDLVGQTPALHMGEGTFAVAAKSLAETGRFHGAVVSRTKAGTLLDIDLSAFAVQDESGEDTFYVGIKRDITHQKRAERRLLLLSEVSRRLVEAQLDAKAVLETVASLLTERLAEVCVIAVRDEETDAPVVVTSGADAEAKNDLRELILGEDGAWADTIAVGEGVFSRETVAVPIRSQARVVGALACRCVPVVAFEEADHHLLRQVGDRVALALDNAHLYRRKEEAVKLRDDFLSIAGHELRTPITTLKLQLTAIERGLATGKKAAPPRLDVARRQVQRLAALTDELLDVSRIATGRFRLEIEAVDLTALVHEVSGRLSEQMALSGSALVLETGGPVVGRWDKLRLDQVITNLLTNGMKYGCGRPITLSVEGDGQVAHLTVRDQGIGIELDKQARIFQRFERAVSTRSYGGLGLGLWIVSQILSALGGSIRVESEPGRGSTFTVDLPLDPTSSHQGP